MHFTDAFKSAPYKSVEESKIPGSKSLRHHDAASVDSSSQSRNPGSAAPGRCNLNGPVMRIVVAVWKRTMHTLRQSSRDSPRGVLTCSRFVMTALRSCKTPWSISGSGTSREASLAGGVNDDSGSAWSLV